MSEQAFVKKDPFIALRHKEFLLYIIAKLLLSLAIQMQTVVIGWQVYAQTKNVLDLGLIGLYEAIPFILVAFVSGYVADTFNRKYVLLLFMSLFTLTTFTLTYLSLPSSTLLVQYGATPIFIVVSIIGITRGFMFASMSPFMTQIVPRNIYTNATTWSSSCWHLAAVIGPSLAGLLCMHSFTLAYKVDLIFALGAIVAIQFIAKKETPVKKAGETIMQSLTAGIKFVKQQQVILAALSLDMFAVLFGGAVALLPAFADKVLHIGTQQLGYLTAAPAIGAIIMAIYIAYRPPAKNAGRDLLIAVAGFGASIIVFGVSTNYYLSMLCLLLTGAFDSVSVVLRQTILQLSTPNEMRGRVSAINSIFIGSSNEIGAFESGLTARYWGLKASVVFGGIMTFIVVGVTRKLAPKLKHLNLNELENHENATD